jgi:hypothetical protein
MTGYGYSNVEQFSYPVNDQRIIEGLYWPQVFRALLEQVNLPNDQLIQFPIEDGDTAIMVNRVAEGAECPIEVIQYHGQVVKTYKIGEGFPITYEEVQYAKIPSVDHKPRKLGYKIGARIDYDCMITIDAAIPLTHIITATGQTTGLNNTVATIANYVGHHDWVDAKQVIRTDGQVEPTDCVMNAMAYAMLEKLPQFGAQFYQGEPSYGSGRRPAYWEGMRVHVSERVPDYTIYVVSTGLTSRSGQYAPLGKFVYNYDIRTISRMNPAKDQNEVYAYSSYAPVVLKGDHLAKIVWTPPYP